MPSFLLKDMPLEIRKYLLKVQGKIKVEKGVNQFSLEKTIYKVIKAQMDLEDKPKRAS